MKTAVDRVKKGKGRIVNARFASLCSHYLFDADFCDVASRWEKGVVEKNVQDWRGRIWQEEAQRRFGTLVELNAWLSERPRALWSDIRHPEHAQFSVAEMLEHEQTHLMPVPVAFDGYAETLAPVSSTCLVSVQRNRCSVPCDMVGQIVSVRLYAQRVPSLQPSRQGASVPPALQALRAYQRDDHHGLGLRRVGDGIRGCKDDHGAARSAHPPLPHRRDRKRVLPLPSVQHRGQITHQIA